MMYVLCVFIYVYIKNYDNLIFKFCNKFNALHFSTEKFVSFSDVELEFIAEPISRLVKISETKAVFRCIASPPSAKIRWLYRGQPIAQNIRWIRESDHKLTVLLARMDRTIKSPHVLNNIYFQCEVRLKGHVLVSAPAKLTLAGKKLLRKTDSFAQF